MLGLPKAAETYAKVGAGAFFGALVAILLIRSLGDTKEAQGGRVSDCMEQVKYLRGENKALKSELTDAYGVIGVLNAAGKSAAKEVAREVKKGSDSLITEKINKQLR